MPDQLPSLAHAAVALALLTFVVYALLTVQGVVAKARGAISDAYVRDKSGPPPEGAMVNTGRNLINLFEFPMLFYVLVGLHAALAGTADSLQVMLGWGFVALRYLHTLVHVTVNQVGLRFLLHRAGVIVLAVMWARFGLAL